MPIQPVDPSGSPLFPKGFPALGMPDQWWLMRPGNELSSLIRGVTLRRAEILAWDFLFQGGLSTFLAVAAVPVVVMWGVFGGLARNRNLSRYVAAAIFGAMLVYISMPNVIESVAGTENMLSSQYHPVRFGTAFWTMATVGSVALIANVRTVWLRTALMMGFVTSLVVDVGFQLLYHFSFLALLRDLGISIYPPRHVGTPCHYPGRVRPSEFCARASSCRPSRGYVGIYASNRGLASPA